MKIAYLSQESLHSFVADMCITVLEEGAGRDSVVKASQAVVDLGRHDEELDLII